MGDWRRVHLVGEMQWGHVSALSDHLELGFDDPRWGPLHNGGIAGLPNWAEAAKPVDHHRADPGKVRFDVVGNLGERGYSIEDVAAELERLIDVCPSLKGRLDFGGPYESDECVGSIDFDGTWTNGTSGPGRDKWVIVGSPGESTIPPITDEQLQRGFQDQLRRRL